MEKDFCSYQYADSPILAIALHDGHLISDELKDDLALNSADRLREEDPFTGDYARFLEHHLIVHYSRFQLDLNRDIEKAVYQKPEDAWGLRVWKTQLSDENLNKSKNDHHVFYKKIKNICDTITDNHQHFVVLDIHSYNHRREDVDKIADPALNPEINIGTATLDEQTKWRPLIDNYISALSSFNFMGRNLDVRENIKFRGGYLAKFLHETYPQNCCCLSIEFKKIFMDEWTGELLKKENDALKATFESSLAVVDLELRRLNGRT